MNESQTKIPNAFKAFGILLFIYITIISVNAQTVVTGNIIDSKTKSAVPFVNVLIFGTKTGLQTDSTGTFSIKINDSNQSKLQFTSVGYRSEIISFKRGVNQEITVRMLNLTQSLGEVKVSAKKDKYRNKDNPAVALIKKVVEHRDENRKESLNYYQYEKYEKIQMNLSNIDEAYKKKKIFKNYQFIFDNLDTSKVTETVSLPLYLKETVGNVYYRKNPKEEKTYIKGEKKVGLDNFIDNNGLSKQINRLYEDVNIYNSNISLVSNQFISPISNIAPNIYRFVILDTLQFQSIKCVNLGFSPRNPADFAFVGNMIISLDSSYSVRKVKLGIPKNINLNFVKDIEIEQEFNLVDSAKLMLVKDDIIIEFGLSKDDSKKGIIGKKTVSYQNYILDKPIDSQLFKPVQKNVVDDLAMNQTEQFWDGARHQSLSNIEQGIYHMADTIQQIPAFKRFMAISSILLFGYKDFGKYEVGPANAFYSFNPIEGFRLRAGGRSTMKFNPNLFFDTYLAYGFKDERWKGYLGVTYNLGKNSIYEFPNNFLRASYQNEVRIPGQELQFVQEDNVLLSFKRGVNDKMTYNKIFKLDYRHELKSGFSYELGFKNLIQEAAGSLKFEKESEIALGNPIQTDLTSSEISLNLRFAPNEQFSQGKNYRTPIVNKSPIFQLRYSMGVSGLFGSEFHYHNLTIRANKRFFVSPIGYTDITAEAGKIFGTVPFPLLNIHRANQSYSYQLESYNLMNFMEFASDKYAAIFVDHYFNGFIFNKLPLIKKLKLREVITFKALYGSISDKNLPENNPNLYRFPRTVEGPTITNSLVKAPYIEASVGIANIFKVFRIDVVRRFSYLKNPNVSEYGIRGRFKFDF